jgi:hypothetical protein
MIVSVRIHSGFRFALLNQMTSSATSTSLTPVIMAGYINSAGTLASVKLYFALDFERRLPLESDFATACALRSFSHDSESRYDSESRRTLPTFMPRSRN